MQGRLAPKATVAEPRFRWVFIFPRLSIRLAGWEDQMTVDGAVSEMV